MESKFYKKHLEWTDNFVERNIGAIERNYKKFPSKNRWNCNCHVVHDNDLDAEPIDYDFLRKEYEQQARFFCESRGLKFKGLGPIWYNYYKSGQYQEPHDHDGGYTFIHYMIFDKSIHSSTKFTDVNIESPEIDQGDILIFDGTIQHYVPANNSTSPRLTTAFTFDAEPVQTPNNEINIDFLFPTPMWWTDLNIDNDVITNECYQLRDSQPDSRGRSTIDGWQSDDLNFDVTKRGILKLVDEVTKISNTIFRSQYLEDDDRRTLTILNYWVCINPKGGYNARHIHPGSFMSGVYYVKCIEDEEQGCLMFHRPEQEDFIIRQHKLIHHDTYYTPVQGRLLLFPSQLSHSVYGNCMDNDRIAISFNIGIND